MIYHPCYNYSIPFGILNNLLFNLDAFVLTAIDAGWEIKKLL